MNDAITINGFEYASVLPEGGVQEWANGLPLVGRRELTSAERDELNKQKNAARWKILFAWPLYIAIFCLLFWLWSETNLRAVRFVMFVYGMVGAAFACLVFRDGMRVVRGIPRDLNSSGVKLYRGMIVRDMTGEGDKGVFAECVLETLAGSNRIWSVDGARDTSLECVNPIFVPTPEEASLLTKLAVGAGEKGRVRILTEPEKDALKLHFDIWGLLLIAIQIVFVGSLLYFGCSGVFRSVALCIFCVALIAIAYFMIRSVIQRLADRRRGFVSIRELGEGESGGGVQEVLPCSNRVWSTDGKPADWR
jgi:uncharacterized membrane protein